MPGDNIKVIGGKKPSLNISPGTLPQYYKDTIPDPAEVDLNTPLPRKIYWYHKNKYKQKKLFNEIEKLRVSLDIKVLIGVFSGILPLVFYFDNNPGKTSVILSDMDSWFTDVYSDMKRFWYRKYFSFNYSMENSDMVDFLSPYIAEGVKKIGVKIKDENISIAPCSFIDYTKCTPGDKKNFEIAFCGRLEPDKNPMMYLEAAKELLKNHHYIKFHLLGEGSLVKEINSFITENKLGEKINFQFHNNPPEILGETSVFVSLQSGTNYPSQSVLEAMACGNAIIASDAGDTNLFVNSKNGIMINLSAGELVKAVDSLIRDKEKTRKLGISAREYALSNHTIEKYSEYFLEIVNKAYSKNFK